MANHTYGWRPDKPDKRDLHFTPRARLSMALPSSIDQTSKHPPITDQGQLGACTAFAGVDLAEYLILNGLHDQNPEPFSKLAELGLYYDERVVEGTVSYDSGAEIRDVLKVIAQTGVGKASIWPYNISKFTQKPPAAYYADAANRQGLVYSRVAQNECVMKGVLAQGLPIIIGFTVYDSFESDAVASTGTVPMPDVRNESVLGGHAVVVVGYDDSVRRWIMRNSWGTGWGKAGYFTFPYEYLLDPDLSSDFWVLGSIE